MINESHANAVPSHYRPARRVASPSHCRQSVRNAIGSLFGAQCVQWPVAVEKLILTKCSEISSHQDALEATSSTRVDIFYPQNLRLFSPKATFSTPTRLCTHREPARSPDGRHTIRSPVSALPRTIHIPQMLLPSPFFIVSSLVSRPGCPSFTPPHLARRKVVQAACRNHEEVNLMQAD